MKRYVLMGLAIAAIAGTGMVASAASFDTDVVSPGGSPAVPGVYFGSGNPNGGFTVQNADGIELGLRAKFYNDGVIHPTLGNLYDVPAGVSPFKSTRADWNFEFSIDLRPGGVGSLTLNDIIASLTISDTHGHTNTIDPLALDDATYGSSGVQNGNSVHLTDWGAQNSENMLFGFLPSYDVNAADTYTFTLNVTDKTNSIVTTDFIDVRVNPTPAPATLWGGGIAMLTMLGLAGGKRLMRKTPAFV